MMSEKCIRIGVRLSYKRIKIENVTPSLRPEGYEINEYVFYINHTYHSHSFLFYSIKFYLQETSTTFITSFRSISVPLSIGIFLKKWRLLYYQSKDLRMITKKKSEVHAHAAFCAPRPGLISIMW